jgi:hypothetical protein
MMREIGYLDILVGFGGKILRVESSLNTIVHGSDHLLLWVSCVYFVFVTKYSCKCTDMLNSIYVCVCVCVCVHLSLSFLLLKASEIIT